MHVTLFPLRRFTAGFAVFSLLGQLMVFPLYAQAHHGGEGSAGALATGAGLGAQQVLALHGSVGQTSIVTDSLWGNLLLGMAYQRDPLVQKYARRLNQINTATLLSVAGISGLGLAQSISALNHVDGPQTLDVETHEDGDSHLHLKGESRTPSQLGVIGSGATLATLGIKAILDHRLKKRLETRQTLIKSQIETILQQMENSPQEPGAVEMPLSKLVGPRATTEFIQLWKATHP